MADPANLAREALLVANRIFELSENPVRGSFDLAHLQAVHAHIFQDLSHHKPGVVRSDTDGWSKARGLEGRLGRHEVYYVNKDVAGHAAAALQSLGTPAELAVLPTATAVAKLATAYGDLDRAHAFYEGNSRTLRELTRSFAKEAGFELDWAPTGATADVRNRLYIARDIAVLERAFPGLTPERGMQSDSRAEYEASLTLQNLRRHKGATLDAIIGEGLTRSPVPGTDATVAQTLTTTLETRPDEPQEGAIPLSPSGRPYTPIAGRDVPPRPADVEPEQPPPAAPASPPPAAPTYRPSSGPSM